MSTAKKFKGIMPPIITTFKEDESFDSDGMRQHVNWLISEGVDGVIPTGSTGEFISMEIDEQKHITAMVIDEVAGRVKVYAGTGAYNTKKVIDLSVFAEKSGADGVLIINPFYIQPSVEDVMNHFRAVREKISIPIMLYNNPWVSGYQVPVDKIKVLFDEGVIQGIKIAEGPALPVHELVYSCEEKLNVVYGADLETPEALLMGSDGWISSVINVAPKLSKRLYDAAAAKDMDGVSTLWKKFMPYMDFTYNKGFHWLQVVKSSLNIMGRPCGSCRKPISMIEGKDAERLREILKDMEL